MPQIAILSDGVFVAAGGHSDVYRFQRNVAGDEHLVAVKVSTTLAGSTTAQRIHHEARIVAAAGDLPGVVRPISSGELADGRAYLVLEFCDGMSLAGAMGIPYSLRAADIVGVAALAARALGRVHARGIVHRDIKPGNLILRPDGGVTLIDFGIAALVGQTDVEATGTSPLWAAPELIDNPRVADPRSDVYSLAATIWAVLAGRAPFETVDGPNSPAHLRSRALTGQIPPLGSVAPDGVEAVLRKALQRDPDRRYQEANDLAERFEALARRLGSPAIVTQLPVLDAQDGWLPTSGAVASAGADDTLAAPAIVFGDDAQTPPSTQPPPPAPGANRRFARPTSRLLAALAAAAIVLAVVAVGVKRAMRTEQAPSPTRTALDSGTPINVAGAVPTPRHVVGERGQDGVVLFTWENPDPQAGDWFEVAWNVEGAEPTRVRVDKPSITIEGVGVSLCIAVTLVRSDMTASAAPGRGCVA